MPPEALIWVCSEILSFMSFTASKVAPCAPKPVDVLMKSAPASDTILLIFAISSSVNKLISMMTFKICLTYS